MNWVIGYFLLLSTALTAAQSFDGTFVGNTPQGALKLTLAGAGGTAVRGELRLAEAALPLDGHIENGVLRGSVTVGARTAQFEARRSGQKLTLRLVAGGQVEEYELAAEGSALPPVSPSPALPPSGGNQFEDRRLGLRFRVPQGWIGRRTESAFVMGSNTQPGIIVVVPHTVGTLDALKREAAQGWIDPGDQVNLPAAGPVRETGKNSVAIDLAGTIQAEKARAHAVGLVSPFGGGVVIFACTSEDKYGPQYTQLAGQIAGSVEFFKPEAPQEAATWTDRFRGRCVAYLKSSYSSGPSFGGYATGSGWSEKRYLYLFEDGSFQAAGSFSGSFDSGGGFGSVNSGPQKQSGKWKVIDQAGQSRLVLEHAGGGQESFALSRQGTQTFLDGRRWLVVSHEECK